MASKNSLLNVVDLPPFGQLRSEDVVPAVESLTATARAKIDELVLLDSPTFESLILPLEELDHRMMRVWSPVSHLQMVESDPDWRAAHQAAIPILTDFATETGQREDLYTVIRQAAESESVKSDPIKLRLVDNRLREFRKAGVTLGGAEKDRFREVMTELANATTQFSQNVQDATDAWSWHSTDADAVAGLPASVIEAAKRRAADEQKDGYLLKLDMPTYQAVMSLADSADLRQSFYEAWSTRASDQGPLAGQFDNGPLIAQILSLRHEAAQLVGFDHYADYALDGRMARDADTVLTFLNDLAERSLPRARKELDELQSYAGRNLDHWDLTYYAEKLKESRFAVSEETLKPYFPTERVVAGLFEMAESLYQIRITAREAVDTWHKSVTFFDVSTTDGQAIGGFYADLFAREGKRAGAWIDECIVRNGLEQTTELPVGYLVCNFSEGSDSHASELGHYEVVTLFHEFGHMLHHLLTRIDFPTIAGINGVPWDAVELPSQFMENFAWEYDVLVQLSAHRETGQPIDKGLYDKLTASRQFNAALAMMRQLEFALFDFRLHAEFDASDTKIVPRILSEVRQRTNLLEVPDWNRFANSFSHIFAGGYAAGYYSYKWAEVLAADAYTALDNKAGQIDVATAARFRTSILEIGGSRDILDAFVDFRGREPSLEPLLRVAGIAA